MTTASSPCWSVAPGKERELTTVEDIRMREKRWVKDRSLRSIRKDGRGESLSELAIWAVVTAAAKEIGLESFGAHNRRWSCAKLCRAVGRDLEQIKFLLGHSSIRTTERYLGAQQDIAVAVNDSLRL